MHPRSTKPRPVSGHSKPGQTTVMKIPPLATGDIRIIPLGGVEEIGKNMTVIEFGNDIIIVDAGLKFADEDTPGIDYLIPDTTYLEENKEKIRGVVITHGHLDHIGGLPYILPRIGNPPVYTRNLTGIMLQKRQEEFPHLPKLQLNIVENEDKVRLGELTLRFFNVTHTIPDAMGIIVETPYGLIVNPGDFKLEHENGVPTDREEKSYEIFDKEQVLLLMTDSTNVENPGFSISEKEVHKNLEEIIKQVQGRLFIGLFASQLERIIKVIEIAERYGRKVVVEGRSMKTNIEVAILAGLLKTKKDTIVASSEASDYPDNKLLVLATGAQGEEFAAMMRMATKTHKFLRFTKGDTVILSSSIIPGNDKMVEKLKDNIARQGAKIIHYRSSEVYIHSSGHGNREEISWLHKRLKPRFLIPVHGNHHRLRIHADLAIENGIPEKNIIVPDNSMIVEITDKGQKIAARKETASNKLIMVDNLGSDSVKEVVIRDRQMLSQDGIFVIITLIDVKTGKVRKSPDIISRGFIYLKESQDLLRQVRIITKRKIEEATTQMHPINFDYVKNIIREEVGKYLFQKTHNRPIILPVLIEV